MIASLTRVSPNGLNAFAENLMGYEQGLKTEPM
jgi:hypothetical protein